MTSTTGSRLAASPAQRYLLALGASLLTVLLLLFGIGALGIVGESDRDAIYLAAPAVALVVAVATRFRASGMAVALTAASVTTVVAGVVAVVLVATDREEASLVDVVGISGMYAVLFAFAAWLFTRVRASGA
jgi:hypothetical protein